MSAVPELRGVATQVATVVDRIRELETRADAAEDEAIACKYEAARLIAEELERRQGGVRALAREIGKSHTHVERMERVHRKHGGKPHVKTLSEWNKLYKGPQIGSVSIQSPMRHVAIRTPAGYLAEAEWATGLAMRNAGDLDHVISRLVSVLKTELGEEVLARHIVAALGEDVVRLALGDEVEDEDAVECLDVGDDDPEDEGSA
jgi:hypothetical protein